ncbi:sensor histidine kinase [Sphingomonas gilva]|uniref:histidine kinase n=1 Tax=Sphingomonas gilva TaxID=2305907 RepID=A0A396RPA4_9SPHN|nr:ATP-binding protein [Sphingomonas gilva]RHW18364.1 sensor histidine kinase [Sphingomonas gilva]
MREAVSDRLTRGLTIVGLTGGLALIAFVSLDVDVLLEQQSAQVGWRGEWLEIAEHVVLPLILLMLPMYLGIRLVVRRSLEPLSASARHIDAVKGTERGFRLDTTGFPAELLPFADAINNLLGRLDDVAHRRETAAAEAAHELKTPLAILMLELDRLGGPDAARLKGDVKEMSRLLDQMLLTAQVDAHATAPVPLEMVSLAELAEDVVIWLAPIALEQGKEIVFDRIESGMVMARRELLRAAMRNLVENGLRATPTKGTVFVLVGPGRQFRVRDEGPGLTAEQLDRRVRRLPRSDPDHVGGAGMGLSIVSRIITVHGGSLQTIPKQREIVLVLPDPGTSEV